MTRFVSAVVAASVSVAAWAADFGTPESAIRSLEAAYSAKDIEAVVAAKDFTEEAKFMLQKLSPDLASDPQLLKQTADMLELSFRKEMKEKGFPDFSKLKCSLGPAQTITPTLVKLTERCVFPDGGTSAQDLHVAKGARGWRVVVVQS